MKRAIIVAALLLQLAPASLAQQEPSRSSTCSQSEVNRTAAQVHSARKHLLDLPIGDGLETDVSPTAQQAVASMKDALADFINSYMRCAPSKPDSATIRKKLSTLGDAFEMPRGQVIPNEKLPPDFGKFGFELSFDVKVIENPRLVGVAANFSIECGGDTVLLIFAPDDSSWKEVLRWQKKPYARVDGGTLAFDYGISPPDNLGQWYIVTHDVAPWCSSTWSSIRYTVLRPTAEPLHPMVLLSASDGIWYGNDDFGSLTVQKDAFDLRFHSSSIDAGVHNRVWIRHYSVIGDTVLRTRPVAVSPRDFVDEWVVSPWEQAVQWSSKSAIEELKQAHEELSKRRESANSLLEYDSVCRCSESADHYQVEINEESEPDFKTARSFYFQVVGASNYTMVQVSENRDPRCTELQNQAAEIRIRAERRAGELLGDMQTSGERQAKERGRPKKVSSPTTLPKLGITRDQSSKWQRLARMIDDATFDKAVAQAKERDGELTTAGLLRAIREIVTPTEVLTDPDVNVVAAELTRDIESQSIVLLVSAIATAQERVDIDAANRIRDAALNHSQIMDTIGYLTDVNHA